MSLNKVSNLTELVDDLQKKVEETNDNVVKHTPPTELVDDLQKKVEETNNNVVKHTPPTELVDDLQKKVEETNNNVVKHTPPTDLDSNAVLMKLDASYSVLSSNLSELDLKQQLIEHSSYNGKLLWKIDNY